MYFQFYKHVTVKLHLCEKLFFSYLMSFSPSFFNSGYGWISSFSRSMNYGGEWPQQCDSHDRKLIWFCYRLLLVGVFLHFDFCFLIRDLKKCKCFLGISLRLKIAQGMHKRTNQPRFQRYSLGCNQTASSKGTPALKPCPPPPTYSSLAASLICPASSLLRARTAAREKESSSSSKHSLKLFWG